MILIQAKFISCPCPCSFFLLLLLQPLPLLLLLLPPILAQVYRPLHWVNYLFSTGPAARYAIDTPVFEVVDGYAAIFCDLVWFKDFLDSTAHCQFYRGKCPQKLLVGWEPPRQSYR